MNSCPLLFVVKLTLRLTLALALIVPVYCYAHDPSVHALITEHAQNYLIQNSVGYSNFLSLIGGPSAQLTSGLPLSPDVWMRLGSRFEDNAFKGDVGGFRQANHFYDPFSKEGLSDWPINWLTFGPANMNQFGVDSFTWASTINCPGVGLDIAVLEVPLPYPNNSAKSNIWSFQNARQYQWQGLTNSDPAARSENGQNVLDPVKVEEAKHTQDCQPAVDDPLGNWGAVTNGLQASIRFAKKLYGTNEPVVATVIARNLSTENRYLAFPFDLQSAVALFDPASRPLERKDWESTNTFDGKVQRMAQRVIWRTLEPGAQIKLDLDLRKWFAIAAVGEYRIHTMLPAPRLHGISTNDMVISGDATFRVTTNAKEEFPIEISCRSLIKGAHFKTNQPAIFVISVKNVSDQAFQISASDPSRDFRFLVSRDNWILHPKIYPLLDKEIDHSKMVFLKPGENRDFEVDLMKLYDFPFPMDYKMVARVVIWQNAKKYGEAESSPVEISVRP